MKFIKLLQTSGLVRKKVLVRRKGGKPFWSTRWVQEGQDVKEVVRGLGFEVVEEEKIDKEREPTNRVKLQGWGDSPAILANEIRVGDIRLFNQGEDTIINIEQKTPKTLIFTYAKKDNEGKNYTQNVRKTTKIVIKELYDDEIKKESNINKGEKIIYVKGSSKVKAHKRRIHISHDLDRIGDKEKDTKGLISTDYKESVKNTNDYISNLNQTDEGKKVMESMDDYTNIGYLVINEFMKNPKPILKDHTSESINKIKNKVSNIKKFINDAPKFEGEVYRGLQYNLNDPETKQRWNTFIKNIEGLKEIKFGSFLSTSQSKIVGAKFATSQHYGKNLKSCLITIKTKSGITIENISHVQSEHEVLLDNNKTYKIISFEKQDERNHFLELQEI